MSPAASAPGIAIAALVYLMTQYSRTRCPLVARAICDHLQRVSGHPQADPALRDVAQGSLDAWQSLCAPQSDRPAVHPTSLH